MKKMKPGCATIIITGLLSIGHLPSAAHAEWFLLRWIENPPRQTDVSAAAQYPTVEFRHVFSFDKQGSGDSSWRAAREKLQEGDVIAYWKEPREARKEIFLRGKLNIIGYRLLKYGHIAMVIQNPDQENDLRLLSSWSFKGPNIAEDLDSLKGHGWDVYRLNLWDRVDKARLYEFVDLVRQKAEKWYGYDFTGMFGLWNANFRPTHPEAIGYAYTCSTVIVAALHYAGVQLDVSPRYGIADIITPLQLVRSRGRIISVSGNTQERSVESQISEEPDAECCDG